MKSEFWRWLKMKISEDVDVSLRKPPPTRWTSGVHQVTINFSGEDGRWLALRQGLQRHGTRAVRPGGRHLPAAAADSHRFRAVPVEFPGNLEISLGFWDGNRAIPERMLVGISWNIDNWKPWWLRCWYPAKTSTIDSTCDMPAAGGRLQSDPSLQNASRGHVHLRPWGSLAFSSGYQISPGFFERWCDYHSHQQCCANPHFSQVFWVGVLFQWSFDIMCIAVQLHQFPGLYHPLAYEPTLWESSQQWTSF